MEVLDEMTDGDKQMQQSLLALFLGQSKEQLDSIVYAFNKKDLSTLANTLHKLKSSSKMIGALVLSRHCANMEEDARSDSFSFEDNNFSHLIETLKKTIEEVAVIVERGDNL